MDSNPINAASDMAKTYYAWLYDLCKQKGNSMRYFSETQFLKIEINIRYVEHIIGDEIERIKEYVKNNFVLTEDIYDGDYENNLEYQVYMVTDEGIVEDMKSDCWKDLDVYDVVKLSVMYDQVDCVFGPKQLVTMCSEDMAQKIFG